MQRSRVHPRRVRKASKPAAGYALKTGDLVVHLQHGVGRLEGLQPLADAGAGECFEIAYADGKILVPVANSHLIMYYGAEGSVARLDRLKGEGWTRRRDRSSRRIGVLARRLVGLAALRRHATAPRLQAPATASRRFVAGFPFKETPDQDAAIRAVLEDLASGRPMDRLVCGDVGSGKTEVALRAAFAAAMNRYQVAVLVPTTVLAGQHFKTFQERFKGFPVRLGLASRTASGAERRELQERIARGDVEIVIGTHALLSSQTRFAKLGLLIIDEEHRFGVRHKERLKQLREGVHVLTLTATPIPRTLQLAMASVRSLSLILTPPEGRRPIETRIVDEESPDIPQALRRERKRGGRSFYVCPRIADLQPVAARLAERSPELRVAIAHAKLPAGDLDDLIGSFAAGACDVLLSTSIVESGLDVPQANTMVIHRSDRFGLAQLYQLRGRVGRSSRRARCLVCVGTGKVSAAARQRLQTLVELGTVGAGFKLAERDMDLRGPGNALGEEQSGWAKDLGLVLFQVVLERAIVAHKQGRTPDVPWSCELHLGIAAYIPADYVPDAAARLSLYGRLAIEPDGAALMEELTHYGPPPEPVRNLVRIHALRRHCEKSGVERVEAGPKGIVLTLRNATAQSKHMYEPFRRRAAAMGMDARMSAASLALRADLRDARLRMSALARLVQTGKGKRPTSSR